MVALKGERHRKWLIPLFLTFSSKDKRKRIASEILVALPPVRALNPRMWEWIWIHEEFWLKSWCLIVNLRIVKVFAEEQECFLPQPALRYRKAPQSPGALCEATSISVSLPLVGTLGKACEGIVIPCLTCPQGGVFLPPYYSICVLMWCASTLARQSSPCVSSRPCGEYQTLCWGKIWVFFKFLLVKSLACFLSIKRACSHHLCSFLISTLESILPLLNLNQFACNT